MKTRLFLVLVLTLALVSGYFVGTQHPSASADATTNPEKTEDKVWNDAATKEMAVDTDALKISIALMGGKEPKDVSRQPVFDLVESYRIGTQSPDGLKGLAAKALNSFHLQKAQAQSAPQVSQAAAEAQIQLSIIQIQQNQRIIGLLEQIAKKK